MEQDCRIRTMVSADLPAVVAMEQRCYAYPWSEALFRRELDNPLSCIEVILIDGRLAGYLCSWQVADELHILNVATSPEHRRRGAARALLNSCLERGRGSGASQVLLEVREGNAGAIALYRKHGFRIAGCRLRYYPDGENALLMQWTEDSGKKRSE